MPGVRSAARRRLAPLRVRLTLAFASVMALVLGLTAILIQLQFANDLTQRIDSELADQQQTFVALGSSRSPQELLTLVGEPLAQVYLADGTVTATTRRLGRVRLATVAEVRGATATGAVSTKPGVTDSGDGVRRRVFALPGGRVAAIAEDLDVREHALHRLALLLAIGMTIALIAASLTGYQVAKAALAPVERMRRRADRIGAGDLTDRLPVPATADEIERLAETMNALLGRLEDAVERERRIVGDASHELRTPISILRARVGFALRGDLDAGQLRDVLSGVDEDAARLGELADDLLVLARADQGALALRQDPLDVQDLLEEAAQRSRAVDPAVAVDVHVELDGGGVVLGDPARLGQLLDNLLQNARRYGEPPVTLTARGGSTAATIAIDVADEGPGFPPQFVGHAFERFSQADPSHGGGGTGLGLSIVEAIASAHGGTVTARPGRGAVVTVELPAA